ncbi:unnamed protein product [Hyaloperonospora brassicae]|uniref:Uncharacterized protein n=1 Tax=Hyaloperonospora brassicae TaxID=162125 RepID=A0AAV0SY46_HYABA|nr:unnamed protein product [Hyaloperonospora brassicae]
MLKTACKVAALAAAVACYVRPQLLLPLRLLALELDQADIESSGRTLQALLSYGLACGVRPSWLRVLVAVAALHVALWGLQRSEDSVLGLDVDLEKDLFAAGAVACFAVVGSILLFGSKRDARDRFQKRLVAFYTKHNPGKLGQVDELVEKYELNEELLFQRLHRKYNALAAGADNHSVMKKIDESEFLYEEEEEDRVESDEEVSDSVDKADGHVVRKEALQDRFSSGTRSASAGNAGKVRVGASVPVARQLDIEDYDELDGTPPVSPRTAGTLAHTRRQSSALIKKAIVDARQKQKERIERRIATMASKKGDGYAGH